MWYSNGPMAGDQGLARGMVDGTDKHMTSIENGHDEQ
jgi:hypothetical protein